MRQTLICAIVAAIVSTLVVFAEDVFERDDDSAEVGRVAQEIRPAGLALTFTDALTDDTWVNATRGAGADRRVLTDASNSICYLTKIQIKGVQAPEDSNMCGIEIDEFTGFWALVAEVEEGGTSEVRCNARCLVWERESTQ